MTYATAQDMVLEFGDDEIRQLSDRSNTGEIDPGILQSALVWADSVINDHIRGIYSIPLNPVPVSINRVAMELAWSSMHNTLKPEAIQARENAAMKYLQRVRTGMVVLESGEKLSQSSIGGAAKKGERDRVFTKDTLAGF